MACPKISFADAGVLIATNAPAGSNELLSIKRMSLDISIRNNHATVRLVQVFENHTRADLEGRYIFRVPDEAMVSKFAIWEDGLRIPGIILERKKAREIYDELTSRKIDPGLLEAGRNGGDDEVEANAFTVKVYPIPAFGTKRLEISYDMDIPIVGLESHFVFPLKPDLYSRQSAREFDVKIMLDPGFDLDEFKLDAASMAFKADENEKDGVISRSFKASDFSFTEDLAFTWKVKTDKDVSLNFKTYRDPDYSRLDTSPGGGKVYTDKFGYFIANAQFNLDSKRGSDMPRDVLVLFDLSISMQYEKLDTAWEALSYFLEGLSKSKTTRLKLITFNDEVRDAWKGFKKLDASLIAKAQDFVRASYLSGGSDIGLAIDAALEAADKSDSGPAERGINIVVLSDGHPTFGKVSLKEITDNFSVKRAALLKKATVTSLFAFGIGQDSNSALLAELASMSDGYYTWAGETENMDFKLKTFLQSLSTGIIRGIKLAFSNMANIKDVYPADDLKAFDLSQIRFVGRYEKPSKKEQITLVGTGPKGRTVKTSLNVQLPEKDTGLPILRRLWAKARVDFLLKKIRYEGERDEWVNEIISLSREHNFSTPYTSFLAAPRSMLRPRVIKPGDPVLRVQTDADIRSVSAIFPWNEIHELYPVRTEEDSILWETRFLAPKDTPDDSYVATIIMKDTSGHQYREDKSFIIDSKPPDLYPQIDNSDPLKPGDELKVRVRASKDTRRIHAKIEGLPEFEIVYDHDEKACLGSILIPRGFPAGTYTIKIFAEDFARNSSVAELSLEVVGW